MDAVTLGAANAFTKARAFTTPRPVVIETDMVNDVDDAMGLRVALALDRQGVIKLLAVAVSSTNATAATAVSALLHDEDRDDIPVGQYTGSAATVSVSGDSGIGAVLSREYAHPAVAAGSVPDSTTVLRTALANHVGADVTYMGMGFQNALAAALASPADGVSSLTGKQLFAAKVKRVLVIAGDFSGATEFNAAGDPTSLGYVLGNCTAPLYVVGVDFVGSATGLQVASYPGRDLLRRTFEVFGNGVLTNGRAANGPLAVLLTTADDLTTLGFAAAQGTVSINTGTGVTTWTAGSGGPHYRVTRTASASAFTAQIEKLLIPGNEPLPAARAQAYSVTRRRGPWTPSRIQSGAIVTWLRGRDLGTVGTAVSSWPSVAPAAWPGASQANATYQPVVGWGVDGRKVARWAHTNAQYLDIADARVRVSWPMLFVVCSAPLDAAGNQSVAGVPQIDGSHTAPFWRWGLTVTQNGVLNPTIAGSLNNNPNIVRPIKRPQLLMLDSRRPASLVNGVDDTLASTIPVAATYPNATPLRIGGNGAASTGAFSEAFNGDLYELLLCDGSLLTQGEYENLIDYFKREFGGLSDTRIGQRNRQVLSTSGTLTLDATGYDNVQINLGANLTGLTINNPGHGDRMTLELIQDATGSRTIALGSLFKFTGGAAPTWSTTANYTDLITFEWNGGTQWSEVSRSIGIH